MFATADATPAIPQLVRQMAAYARQHYHRPLRLADVAAALHRNPAYLCDLFSHATGTTFHHYLDNLRLAQAKALLREPAKPILDVAYAVGYTDANYFRQAFKARTGYAPSAWRERHTAAFRIAAH